MWPFSKKKPSVKVPKKVALINVADYPKKLYSAYWEIRVTSVGVEQYEYDVHIYKHAGGELVAEVSGAASTKDEADTEAQKWVLKQMKSYKRDI